MVVVKVGVGVKYHPLRNHLRNKNLDKNRKTVTNSIMQTTNYPHITKDSKGNLIHSKHSGGYESWYEYDSNNNLIHSKHSNGTEHWNEYDSNNNLIHYKDSNETEYWNEYDSNNKLIHSKYSNGTEYWYDSKGNRIPNPDLQTEITLQEIAAKFNIPVEKLKIKK